MTNELSVSDRPASDELIRGLLESDSQAWDRFAQQYTPVVHLWAKTAGLQASDIADLTQEVFGVVARRLNTFRISDSEQNFHLWMWAITRNTLRQFFRGIQTQPKAIGGDQAIRRLESIPAFLQSDSPPNGGLISRVKMDAALKAIRNDFRENTWQAFWRMAVNQETASAIASDLNMNARAVRQAKFRVLCRLKDEMASYAASGD